MHLNMIKGIVLKLEECWKKFLKVWQIQLNVHLLNDDGNIIDCAYLASYIAFHHFRLPQSSLSGTDLIIYPSDERQPIPLSFNHSPHLISWLIFPSHNPRNPGSFVIDGTAIERSNCTAQLTLAVNLYKELCYFKVQNINPDGNVDGNSSGSSNRMHCGYRIDKHMITQYSLKAYEKAKWFEDMVTSALQKENTLRDDWHGSSEESELMKRWVERNFSVDINKSTLENSFNNSCNLDPSLNNVKNEEKVKSIGKPIKSKYINAWFSDIPDLKCLEEKDEKKRNKLDRSNRGKETNKKSVSDKGNTEPDEANDIVLIKGLNFRIGQIDESENSEEEAIMMELGDSELEEKYKPKSSHKNNIKKKARKKKDEDE
ncbi:exosome complex component RRP45-like isoform X2 [Gordionus sp. m RMFG-2023]|uniref:exosome complex component RRP45-like isoform X2 n=1 Tax=Gordionus sp. m RMFG-2023 TaxID=3053472 RepID=UPI0031FBB242